MSKNTSKQDNNSVVTNGAIINGATVTDKRESTVIMQYTFGNKPCSGVMHISQFPALDRTQRDTLFAAVKTGDKFDGLEATVVQPDVKLGRQFTSVQLSGRVSVQKELEQKRQTAQAERQLRESAHTDALAKVNGKVVEAVLVKVAYSKDPQTKKPTSHFFGAFLACEVDGEVLTGLLHMSRMTGVDRSQRLLNAVDTDKVFVVLASITDKGLSFSEEGVKEAQQAAVGAKFLEEVRAALASGTAASMSFPAKLTENRLDSGAGITAMNLGVRIEVSSDDLGLDAKSTRGTGHQLKLVPVSEANGVITAKRFRK